MATVELITAEQFALLPDAGRPNELFRGRVCSFDFPYPRHGLICAHIAYFLCKYLEEHDIGHAVGNDSAVITERNPDTVRGADAAFYSYDRVPPGPLPDGYLPVLPDLVFEVRSHGDRWSSILRKVAEYLEAGVRVVGVLDPQTQMVRLYQADQPEQTFTADDELTIPAVLPDWRVPVRRFFE